MRGYFIGWTNELPFIIQLNMYTQGSNPASIQMQRYPPGDPAKPAYSDTKGHQEGGRQVEEREEAPSKSNYFIQLCLYILAMGINIGLWAIDYFAVGTQASYYYSNAFSISPFTDTMYASYTDSTGMFNNFINGPNSAVGVAMSLIYSWLLWKLSLMVFAYHVVSRQEGSGLRIGTVVTLILVLLTVDILLTIFALSFYNEYLFYGFYVVFGGIVVLVNAKEKGRALGNFLIPLLIIAFLYFSYAFLLPSLYQLYYNNLGDYSSRFIVIYSYPIIDLIFYAMTLGLGTKVDNWVKGFLSSIHFLLLGYGVGMILLVGYTEVEFYYLLAYFIFRNIFVNYIMRHWQKVVSNPPALPAWIMSYYISYALSYLPVIGIGRVVVAKSFSSYIFALARTLLYGSSNPLYPSTTAPVYTTTPLGTNLTLSGNIFWLGAAIIWVGITFTQKYPMTAPKLYDLFYYLFGIHLFYLGIASSLSLQVLKASSFV